MSASGDNVEPGNALCENVSLALAPAPSDPPVHRYPVHDDSFSHTSGLEHDTQLSLHDCSVQTDDSRLSDSRVSLPAMTELIISQARRNDHGTARPTMRCSSPEMGTQLRRARLQSNHQRAVPSSAANGHVLAPRGTNLRRSIPRKPPAQAARKSLALEIADEFQVFSKEAVPEAYRTRTCKALLQAEKENWGR